VIDAAVSWPVVFAIAELNLQPLTATAGPPGRRFRRHRPVKPLAAGRRVGENAPLENFRGGEPASRRTSTLST